MDELYPLQSPVFIINLYPEGAAAVIDLTGIDQGQVGSVLLVLLEAVDPGVAGEGGAIGHGGVEDAVLPAATVGGAGAGSDDDAAQVSALRGCEQGSGQAAPGGADALDAPAAQFGVDDVGNDALLAGCEGQGEAGRLIRRPDPIGHEGEIEGPLPPGEVGQGQFGGELLGFDNHGQGLPHLPLQ